MIFKYRNKIMNKHALRNGNWRNTKKKVEKFKYFDMRLDERLRWKKQMDI